MNSLRTSGDTSSSVPDLARFCSVMYLMPSDMNLRASSASFSVASSAASSSSTVA